MTDVEHVVRATAARARAVSDGVHELLPILSPVLPLASDGMARLDLMQRTASVAFLKRFEQLQDLVGRLGRAVMAWEGAIDPPTVRDLGNWFEKRGLIDSAIDWMVLARLRNRLVHEYPVDDAEQVARLNDSWTAMSAMLTLLANMNAHLSTEGLV